VIQTVIERLRVPRHGAGLDIGQMIDGWGQVLAGYASPEDAFCAAQAHIKRVDKEARQSDPFPIPPNV
jgi:hypothetical protein